MRLMMMAVATCLLCPASIFAQGDGSSSSRDYLTGNKLYEICTSTSSELCLGYVMGASDALNLSTSKQNIFCLPTSVTAHQELAVVIKYLRDHPDPWHYSAASDVGVALAMAFPCKEQPH